MKDGTSAARSGRRRPHAAPRTALSAPGSLGRRFTGVGMFDAPGGPSGEPAAIAGDPFVDPVQEPRSCGNTPDLQRQPRVPGDGNEQSDRSRAPHAHFVGNGPRRTIRLCGGQTRSVANSVSLSRDDVEATVTVEAVEPTGRPRTEASIPVEDQRRRPRHERRQRPVVLRVVLGPVTLLVRTIVGVHAITVGCARRPSRTARTPRRAGRHH